MKNTVLSFLVAVLVVVMAATSALADGVFYRESRHDGRAFSGGHYDGGHRGYDSGRQWEQFGNAMGMAVAGSVVIGVIDAITGQIAPPTTMYPAQMTVVSQPVFVGPPQYSPCRWILMNREANYWQCR